MIDETETTLYRCYDASGTLLYVGITNDLEQRHGHHAKHKDWWPEVVEVKTHTYATRALASAAEGVAIWDERPLHNVDGRYGTRQIGGEPDRGKFLLRTMPALHESLVARAAEQGVSLNQLVVALLAGGIGFKMEDA